MVSLRWAKRLWRTDTLERRIYCLSPARYVDPACVPEPAARPYELVVRRVDEDFDGQALLVVRQLVAEHLTDRDAAVVDGRAAADRAQTICAQDELCPWHLRGDGRRLRQSDELARRLTFTGIELDIGAGQQGAEPRDAAEPDPRPDDPEARALHVRFHSLVEPGGDDDVGQVLAQGDLVDQADLDVTVFDPGLAGLEAFGVVEHDRDLRPFLLQRSRVPSPETPPNPTRGRTIQKRVPSFM
jgi:hypothetical protein